MPDEFYIYLGVYVVLAILGLIYQERDYLQTKYKERKEKKLAKKNKKAGKHGDDDYIIEETKDDED